jgi:hypothetical protein
VLMLLSTGRIDYLESALDVNIDYLRMQSSVDSKAK